MLKVLPVLALVGLIASADAALGQLIAPQRSLRTALVIGNGAYAEAPIPTAVEGARSVADVLRLGGFKLVYLENARRDEIEYGLETFAQALEEGAAGFVFYAGHAVQYQGRNYLVALDSNIAKADDVKSEAIDVDLLLDPLLVARSPGSVVILDASRNNPWQQRLPGNLRGLAAPEPVRNISIMTSAAPGKVVGSSPQADSVFTAQLVQAMKRGGLGFDAVFSRTKSAVNRINGSEQVPWESSPPPADLVIIEATAATSPTKAADAVELGFWDTIKNSSTTADFQAYLSAYPDGQFTAIARAKLAQLQPKPADSSAQRQAPGQEQAIDPAAAPAPQVDPVAAFAPIRDCPACPELVLLPAGAAAIGSTEGFAFESPVHDVTIGKAFYIGRREVTFEEWDACLSEGGCQYRPGDRGLGRGLNPVSDLDWNDAKTYLAWLSRKTGKSYRLPTEAEWEYAARAGTKTIYYWGNKLEKDRANCTDCNTSPINKVIATGTFPANPFGLFDMAGNAAEWVEDCWADNYKAAPKDGSAYTKSNCRERVLRGGSFNNDARFVRTAARFKYDFDVRYYTNGFRVAREQ